VFHHAFIALETRTSSIAALAKRSSRAIRGLRIGGRDTFIAIRGLCIATDRLDEARSILLEWAGAVSEGMLPNRFPNAGDAPEYNSVDASLWYLVAVYDFIRAARDLPLPDRHRLEAAVDAILTGYTAGNRYGIRTYSDGPLAAGVPDVQLTWMDAKV
jgi:predicted glycogen debranching enzyme